MSYPSHGHQPAVRSDLATAYGPEGPPIGSVMKFEIQHPSSAMMYTYAAIRAGNGLWYVTGGETQQGVSWGILIEAIRPRVAGPIQAMVRAPHLDIYL